MMKVRGAAPSLRASLAGVLQKLRPGHSRPRSPREIFTDIYRRRLWANRETVSGPGSTRRRAASFREDLRALLANLDTHVLLDAGCGDFNWMVELGDAVDSYIGVDVVSELIAYNTRQYGRPGRTFLCRDITSDPLPRADVILCRDCLVHLSLADVGAAVRNFVRSGSTYILTTSFFDIEHNAEITTGGWRELDFQRPPFLFPPPLATIDERLVDAEGRYRDKRFALWALDSVAALRDPNLYPF
jgi:SAM-dependent methyltransferase